MTKIDATPKRALESLYMEVVQVWPKLDMRFRGRIAAQVFRPRLRFVRLANEILEGAQLLRVHQVHIRSLATRVVL